MATWTIVTDRPAKYSGACIVCGNWAKCERHWETLLVTRQEKKRGQKPTTKYGVGHADCLGGKFGGVQNKWRGPATVTVKGN